MKTCLTLAINTRRERSILAFVVKSLLCFLLIFQCPKAQAMEDSVILFKQLMSNSVAVEFIAFETYVPKYSEHHRYVGRWDNGNFFLAEINTNFADANVVEPRDPQSLSNLTSTGMGRVGNLFWRRDSKKILTVWTNSAEALGDFDPPCPNLNTNMRYAETAELASHERESLLRVLHFGMGVLKPNTINWNGSNFEVIDNLGRKIEGELVVENGHPAQLRYKYAKDGGLTVISFEYQKSFPFPSRMESTYIAKDNTKKPLTEWEISSFATAVFAPLAQGLFDPRHIVQARESAIIEMNHAFYEVRKDNTLVNIQTRPHPGQVPKKGQ